MSPRFLADENIDPDLVLGLQRRVEGIDIVRAQEVGLRTLDDPTILGWAARERILISRDIKTIPDFARACRGRSCHAGVFVLAPTVSMSTAIDELAAGRHTSRSHVPVWASPTRERPAWTSAR